MKMKKISIILAALASMMLVSCSKEVVPAQEEDEGIFKSQEIVISAYSADGSQATRTSRDSEGNFYWSPRDRISLFYGSGSDGGSVFTSTNSEPAQKVDFSGVINVVTGSLEGDVEEKYWGIYPYNEINSCDGTALVTEVLSEQVAAEGTFADGQFVSIACSQGLSMGFYHLCGGIKFFLENEGITRIVISGNAGETIAGKVQVVLDDENHPVVDKFLTSMKEVEITPPQGEETFKPGVEYFMVLAPVTFSKGFTVSFEKGSTYGNRRISSSMSVNRARFQWSEQAIDTGVEFVQKGTFGEIEYFDMVPSSTRDFIENVDYSTDPDYTYSYVKSNSISRTPVPFSATWNGTAATIAVSTSPGFESTVLKTSVSTSPASVYNLIPDEKYYYRVTSAHDVILKEGCMIPIGPLRMIYGAANNTRDLGGWSTEDGSMIAYGKLYRGAQVDNLSSSGKKVFLETMGVKVDLDLRGYDTGSPSQVFSDIDYCNIRLWQFLGNGSGETSGLYQLAIRNIIGWLEEGMPVYFHCIGGADRTGTLAFLIEALLGVSESDMSKEYELTSSRYRNDETGRYPFKTLINYLKEDQFGDSTSTIQKRVYNWAMTDYSEQDGNVLPLTSEEITRLRELLLIKKDSDL